MRVYIKTFLLLASAAILSGCTHPLAIKNMNMYHNTSLATLQRPLTVGIKSECTEIEGKQLVKMVADALPKYNVRATTSVISGQANLDAIATINVNSTYEGSGWNFLINFPGFLIWAPAWHGYNYEINHDIKVWLTDATSGAKISSFNIPISLDIRHADFNRTWTEIGWLEVGIIPFVGGLVFINYDDTVTPIAHDKAGPVIADYVAQEIVDNLQPLAQMPVAQAEVATEAGSSP